MYQNIIWWGKPEMISQRDAFFNSLFDLASKDRRIILITADCGAPSLDRWRAEIPGQFFNCGIAEQGGLSIAAGLALEGLRPYFYAIAPFATLRCLEQIRVNMAIMRLPIVVVGVGAGLSYEDSGPTHHALEDLAVMRALPGITVWNITDSVMASKIVEISYLEGKPAYVRLDREVREPFCGNDWNFKTGILKLSSGNYVKNAAILATGNMVYEAMGLAKKRGLALFDIFRFPINVEELKRQIGGYDILITIEEHFLPGGLGSAVVEILADQEIRISLHRVGLQGETGYSYLYGGRERIRKGYLVKG